MRWKKNGFSYIIWFLYLAATGMGLLGLTDVSCEYLGVPVFCGMAVGAVYILLAGTAVYCLHRRGAGKKEKGDRAARTVAEASFLVILLAAGLVLRVNGLEELGERAAYFETASVIPGQAVPQIAQGAVYFYVQFLHTVFYFLGNKMIVGIFCQILLQLLAAFLLYFAVRRSAGRAGGAVFLCLCMFSAYLRKEAVTLSPETLYLAVWAAVLLWVTAAGRRKFRVWEYFPTGIFLAAACYLDVAGVVLLPVAAGVILCRRREEPKAAEKAAACLLCFLGLLAGMFGLAGADAVLSKKTFGSVLLTWMELYGPKGVRIPAVLGEVGFPTDALLLAGLLVFWIFGFWRDKRYDRMKGWIAAFGTAVLLDVFGCFTSYMPAGILCYLLLAVLAGISVNESFRPMKATGVREEKMSKRSENAETVENAAAANAEAAESAKTAEGGEGAMAAEKSGTREAGAAKEPSGETEFIENPLPLPKKHVKRVLDYSIQSRTPEDDFDLSVDENDDFDL